MKRVFTAVLASVCCVGAWAQPVRFTLRECLEYAFGNSRTRQGLVLDYQSAELSLHQAQMDRLPSVSASASETMNHQRGERRTVGGSAGVSAGVTLWQGGATNKEVERQKLLAKQAGMNIGKGDNSLVINILSSYFTILGYEELQRYQGALIAASEEQVRDGGERFGAGALIESDYLLLKAQLAQNRNNAARTELDIKNEMLSLRALMSMPEDVELELAGPDSTAVKLPEEEEFFARIALPDLELLEMGVEVARSGLRISRSGYWPTLSASGSLSTGHSGLTGLSTQIGDRFNQSAGVSLSIPIFGNGRVRTSVAQSRIALRQAELDREQGRQDIRVMLARSYSDAVAAMNDYSTLVVREQAYRSSLEAHRAMYAAQTIKAVDMLQQENNYISVLYDFIQGKYSLLLRRRILDVYMGL